MSQTLAEFIERPFGEIDPKKREYDKSYKSLMSKHRIKMGGYFEKDGMYFIHIKVGSESSSQFYDVVFLFYTNDPKLKASRWFASYEVRFFSNSPAFLYNYIVLYHQNGVLIDELYDKMEEEYRDKLPKKSNPNMKLSYEKSIYCAGRFMLENKFNFNKLKLQLFVKKKTEERFFNDISTFYNKEMDRVMEDVEKKLKKEIKKEKEERRTKKSREDGKKAKTTSTIESSIKMGKVIKAKKAIGSKPKMPKKRARKSK